MLPYGFRPPAILAKSHAPPITAPITRAIAVQWDGLSGLSITGCRHVRGTARIVWNIILHSRRIRGDLAVGRVAVLLVDVGERVLGRGLDLCLYHAVRHDLDMQLLALGRRRRRPKIWP